MRARSGLLWLKACITSASDTPATGCVTADHENVAVVGDRVEQKGLLFRSQGAGSEGVIAGQQRSTLGLSEDPLGAQQQISGFGFGERRQDGQAKVAA